MWIRILCFVKRRWEYQGCGKKNVNKRNQYQSSLYGKIDIDWMGILRLLERISSGEEGNGTEILGDENEDSEKNGMGEENKVVWNFIHPCKPIKSPLRPGLCSWCWTVWSACLVSPSPLLSLGSRRFRLSPKKQPCASVSCGSVSWTKKYPPHWISGPIDVPVNGLINLLQAMVY